MPPLSTRSNVCITRENGRRSYGPPVGWIDAVPSYHCELFIKNLPKGINEEALLHLFKRFGIVYQFRLMNDSAKLSRGYAFTRYTIELDALAAMEMLNRYFLPNGERLEVVKSLHKRSLYVANIPKELPHRVLHEGFVKVFPKLRKIMLHSANMMDNRGFAFIEFGCHDDALDAKRRAKAGGVRMWGTDLKVMWAQMKPRSGVKSRNTFILRGIDNKSVKQQIMDKIQTMTIPADIKKMEIDGNQGVITVNNSALASMVFFALKDMQIPDFSVDWARNTTRSWMVKRVSDFSAELRMICIANGWQIPIILFGKNYRKNNVQYGSVLLADGNRNFTGFLMEVVTLNVYDVQSTMCELVVDLINEIGGFPSQSLVYKVTNRSGHLVCRLDNLLEVRSDGQDTIRDWESICEMASTLHAISTFSDHQILTLYRINFLGSSFCNAHGCLEQVLPNCLPVYPKYRNKPALVFNLNDSEIILVLRDNTSDDRLPPVKHISEQDENTIHLTWKRKPQDEFVLSYVDAGTTDFYHPHQRGNIAPIWIPGHTYRHSVKNYITYITQHNPAQF